MKRFYIAQTCEILAVNFSLFLLPHDSIYCIQVLEFTTLKIVTNYTNLDSVIRKIEF